jgi:hypothetical protein
MHVKGTVSADFFASGFFHESSSYQPLNITLLSFRVFSICHQCRHRWCTVDSEYLREFSNRYNSPNGIFKGLGETHIKNPDVKNLVALSPLTSLRDRYTTLDLALAAPAAAAARLQHPEIVFKKSKDRCRLVRRLDVYYWLIYKY